MPEKFYAGTGLKKREFKGVYEPPAAREEQLHQRLVPRTQRAPFTPRANLCITANIADDPEYRGYLIMPRVHDAPDKTLMFAHEFDTLNRNEEEGVLEYFVQKYPVLQRSIGSQDEELHVWNTKTHALENICTADEEEEEYESSSDLDSDSPSDLPVYNDTGNDFTTHEPIRDKPRANSSARIDNKPKAVFKAEFLAPSQIYKGAVVLGRLFNHSSRHPNLYTERCGAVNTATNVFRSLNVKTRFPGLVPGKNSDAFADLLSVFRYSRLMFLGYQIDQTEDRKLEKTLLQMFGKERLMHLLRAHEAMWARLRNQLHIGKQNLLKCGWSGDGKRVAAGSSDRFAYVRDASSRYILYKMPGHLGSVNASDLHPTEPILLSAGSDKRIFLGEIP
ncbi:unnamed protein product [Haemonchus placei]|uniref:WD_REPEATS_REGION domain-containing protein n=1 Tax=Haemonchus placei TaxID=6290 RepID=A0A0N4WGG3_HAEPC|nr:unnamed protein product [Haemonchus placei]